MTHKVALHWIREHADNNRDFAHVERMQYRSVKLFKAAWDNRDFCRDLLSVLPRDSYILARDHALSEQKQNMWDDPAGTGTRHANEFAQKVAMGNVHVPVERTFFLGINEPDATNGDRNAIDIYTASFLRRLTVHGLRGGGFNFSTGQPRTVDGTANTPADYNVFEQSHQAIVSGHHIGVLHIYGTGAVPCAPGHYDRLRACTWDDVEWVVGEFGVDEHVIGGGEHHGFHHYFEGRLHDYCAWLDTAIMGINDKRIHSYQVFTYDYSHPWSGFDVSVIRDALESYDWQHSKQAPPTGPTVGEGPEPAPAPAPTLPSTMWVRVVAANLRFGPGTDSDILAELPQGTSLSVTGINPAKDWMQVRYGDMSGWVFAGLLSKHPVAVPTPAPPPEQPPGDNFERCLRFVLKWEGLWADDPNDPGGATMMGITLGTYTRWREAHGQPPPTKDDLRKITNGEVVDIFREWYWLASGADKLAWPLCLSQMDTAVNAGVGRAQEMLAKSNGNFLAYMGHLIDWYTRIPNFEHFGRAWIRRRAEILLEASQ